MLYEDCETDISKRMLASVLAEVESPACLLGGWAVYLAVNARYSQERGEDYHGSKDIDLGFHFSGDESAESVLGSPLAKSIRALERMGFWGVSARMVKAYHRESRRPLGEQEAKRVPQHDLFYMYVDPIVDAIPGTFRDAMGFAPIDEPLLRTVFEDGQYDETGEFGARLLVPKPAVLLAAKMAALPRREKDHKRHKDIADIYALLWYSSASLGDLKSGVLERVPTKAVKSALSGIRDDEYAAAAGAIGEDAGSLKMALGGFMDSCIEDPGCGQRGGSGGWIMPYAVGYATFVKLVLLLGRNADSGPVPRGKIIGAMKISARITKANLDFLRSVGVVEYVEPASCALTGLGLEYAAAHEAGDKEALRRASLDVINCSHLKPLSDMLAKARDQSEIYEWIKTRGGYADGKSPSGMHAPHHAGYRTLLRILRDAGLLRGAPDAPGTGPPRGRASRLASLSVEGVGTVDIGDADTLALAESYLDIVRKRLAAGDSA